MGNSDPAGIAAVVIGVLVAVAIFVLIRLCCNAARARRQREAERRRREFVSGGLQAGLAVLQLQAPPPSQAYLRRRTTGSGGPSAHVPAEPLVCTYSRADGWQEATCPVCLADMEDGETVRVLPPCMHYFHDTCIGEWLRGHNTCPLCRATPAAEDVWPVAAV